MQDTPPRECGNAIPGVTTTRDDLSPTKFQKMLTPTPAASVHIQGFPSIPYQSKPRHKFRAVIQTLTLLLSLAQALPVPADSNGPPLWPEESRVNYPAEPPRTGDLPVNTHLYHRIPIDTSSRQLNMTSLYDAPISTAPPSDMFLRKYHPVSRKYFLNVPDSTPLPTNKFYTNLFLDTQERGFWTAPYMGWWNKDPKHFGISISHADPNQRALGPEVSPGWVNYYINPLGINSITFGAVEFKPGTSAMYLTQPTDTSVEAGIYADLARLGSQTNKMVLPLVQGMGFVTAEYTALQARISSGVIFRKVEKMPDTAKGLQRWRIQLEDGKFWALFVRATDGGPQIQFTLDGSTALIASRVFTGFAQVSKFVTPEVENLIVSTAGAYPTTMTYTASVQGNQGSYTFKFEKRGDNIDGNLLMYALKHHISSFSPETTRARTGALLSSTTKGMMEAVKANSWTMIENDLPTAISFVINGGKGLTAYARGRIQAQVKEDLNRDFAAIVDPESWYFSGKSLANIAQNCMTAYTVGLPDVARDGLKRLKDVFVKFVENRPNYPLVYDTNWGGLVSNAYFQTGDPGRDFGNSHYNDHHFHYGYHIYTASIIVSLDELLGSGPGWYNKYSPFVVTMIRDVANPHKDDKYFSRMRSFDFFHGHSWAKGLFESADGKDQESSSEDMHFGLSMKLWGQASHDQPMEGRANLMMAQMKRSFNEYFYVTTGNNTHPPEFSRNKGGGIYFENKADHTTYFGNVIQYIHGIHMLPFSSATPYLRGPAYCAEEWDTWFQGKTGDINDGWKSVLYGNVACWQPMSAWLFFDQPNYNPAWTTDGTSRSWFMLNAALLGGAPEGIESHYYTSKDQATDKTQPADHCNYRGNPNRR